jgi:hypothetical protein
VSGEEFFRGMLKMPREPYIAMVQETLKFMLIPAFVSSDAAE